MRATSKAVSDSNAFSSMTFHGHSYLRQPLTVFGKRADLTTSNLKALYVAIDVRDTAWQEYSKRTASSHDVKHTVAAKKAYDHAQAQIRKLYRATGLSALQGKSVELGQVTHVHKAPGQCPVAAPYINKQISVAQAAELGYQLPYPVHIGGFEASMSGENVRSLFFAVAKFIVAKERVKTSFESEIKGDNNWLKKELEGNALRKRKWMHMGNQGCVKRNLVSDFLMQWGLGELFKGEMEAGPKWYQRFKHYVKLAAQIAATPDEHARETKLAAASQGAALSEEILLKLVEKIEMDPTLAGCIKKHIKLVKFFSKFDKVEAAMEAYDLFSTNVGR